MAYPSRSRARRLTTLLAVVMLAGACGTATTTSQPVVSSPATNEVSAEAATTPAEPPNTSSPVDVSIPTSTDAAATTSDAAPTSTNTGDAAPTPTTAELRSIDLRNDVILAAVSESAATTVYTAMYMSMDMQFGGEQFSIGTDAPLMTGVTSADRYQMKMDLGAAFGPDLLAELGGIDVDSLTMEMVGDASVSYLKAPFLSDPLLTGFAGSGFAPPDLGDGWGVIDIDELLAEFEQILPEDILTAIGGQNGQSADQWLAMAELTRLLDDTGEPSSSRGVDTTRYTGTITLADMLESGGLGADDFETLMSSFSGGQPGMGDAVSALVDMAIDMSIDIDGAGLVREIAMKLDFIDLMGEFSADLGGETPADDDVFTMTMRFELFDYSNEVVAIEFPSDDEVTADLGQWITSLLGG